MVSAIAAKDSATGNAKILLLNRSYSSAKKVTLEFDRAVDGSVDIYTLNSADITSNNESSENVSIIHTTGSFGETFLPFTVTIPAHSLMRIDMN